MFGSFGGQGRDCESSQQIMVRDLPWSTANEDLVELFGMTAQVEVKVHSSRSAH